LECRKEKKLTLVYETTFLSSFLKWVYSFEFAQNLQITITRALVRLAQGAINLSALATYFHLSDFQIEMGCFSSARKFLFGRRKSMQGQIQ
jgi:hypothetical protein